MTCLYFYVQMAILSFLPPGQDLAQTKLYCSHFLDPSPRGPALPSCPSLGGPSLVDSNPGRAQQLSHSTNQERGTFKRQAPWCSQ